MEIYTRSGIEVSCFVLCLDKIAIPFSSRFLGKVTLLGDSHSLAPLLDGSELSGFRSVVVEHLIDVSIVS